MAKRKKYPKLPNGYGQIRYLGSGRRNPYGVYPPAKEEYKNGQMKPQPALCYVSDWLIGFAVLTSYHAGTYSPGDERNITIDSNNTINTVVQKLLSDYNQSQNKEPEETTPTFEEVFRQYYVKKFKREYGFRGKKPAMEQSMCAAYKNTKSLHDKEFRKLKLDDLQEVVDNCSLKHASLELIVTLYHQMYNYAIPNNLCDLDYSNYVKINASDDDEHGVPFSDDELRTLWINKENEVIEFILIMCYSGYRISAYETIETNIKDKFFRGGIKTNTGKNRMVPIHPGIMDLVKRRIKQYGCLMKESPLNFRTSMYEALSALGIEKHTPHDCRHTFSRLCEKYKVNENDRKRMLGHAFKDITNKVYGHRELDDLRIEIEKIQISDLL